MTEGIDLQIWQQAVNAATDLRERGLAELVADAVRPELADDATEILTVLMYEWALTGEPGQEIPAARIVGQLNHPGEDLGADGVRALARRAPSLRRWRAVTPEWLLPPRETLLYAQTIAAAAVLQQLGGIHLGDPVFTARPVAGIWWPARVEQLLFIDEQPGDVPRIIVRLALHGHDNTLTAAADELLLDVDPADTSGRLGRGTHPHAVRCLVGDLRRTAYLIDKGQPRHALYALAARLDHYAGWPDLHQLIAVQFSAAVLGVDAQHHPHRRGVPATSTAILDAVSQALAAMETTPLDEPAAINSPLTDQARILEARHL